MPSLLPPSWRLEADIAESGRPWIVASSPYDTVCSPVDPWSRWAWLVALLDVARQAHDVEAERQREHGQSAEVR